MPVGDLFDQVSQGDEAFSSDMKIHFENANRLYRQHLKPLLEKEHNLTFEEAEALDWNDPKRAALRNDDRLIKTVLLAALVPEVEALKDMTPARLAALEPRDDSIADCRAGSHDGHQQVQEVGGRRRTDQDHRGRGLHAHLDPAFHGGHRADSGQGQRGGQQRQPHPQGEGTDVQGAWAARTRTSFITPTNSSGAARRGKRA